MNRLYAMSTSAPLSPCFYGLHDAVYEVALHEPSSPHVPEAFVQDLWSTQRFASGISTTAGRPVEIVSPGQLNTDGGPDFRDARVRLGGIDWRGDVEIHVASSGWVDHGHHEAASYNSVVLHVALYADLWTGRLRRADGSLLPELVLAPYLQSPLRSLLHAFHTRAAETLPCAAHWSYVPEALRSAWVEALARERLGRRTARLQAYGQQGLASLLHERLFAGLGFSKNTEPMTSLARRLPLSLVRQIHDVVDLEALHLGVAGLLPTPAELLEADRATADYAMELRDRFERLQLRYEIPVMEQPSWQFFRLRPANTPPLRIAQGVAWLSPGGLLTGDPLGVLVRAIRSDDPVSALREALRVSAGPFWQTHSRLDRQGAPRTPALGVQRADDLIVNAVAPVLLGLAEQRHDPGLAAHVETVLQRLPPARDEVTRRFQALGTSAPNAFTSQGLHQLYTTRCAHARCLTCAIGRYVVDEAPSKT